MVDVATKGDASKSCIRIKNGWVLSSQCNDKYPVCQLDCPPGETATVASSCQVLVCKA